MKIAILGGSFNPPHICHLFAIQYVLATLECQQLWMLPCYRHAFGKRLASFEHRLAMCRFSVAGFKEDQVLALPLEQERQGTSWSIDTVRYLKQRSPEHTFYWIIGSDVLHELERWKDFHELQQLVSFFVLPRAGTEIQHGSQLPEHSAGRSDAHSVLIQDLQRKCRILEQLGILLPAVSSSSIRARIRQQQAIHHLVVREVEQYIREHRLYLS
ncbi:nicotinate (nicotinamide) nucleotide adenylyltransferase [candidate division KSB3 bacterium]|uniref:Probable nicotinate-nucleotide adenylyltransferase n=1 Tax=candidate division KSB3 bacterium TaxID=2044937 RepID=A0A2G6E7R3_9BACT|nr:MAG: nicotinate (nicotinamide) nucleotide adenylyltransferase [candidate division KSB3 bacterium]PIE30465.1 MAG: nicotinate (nicotinamide) nucleotide adenylyltransferase [candidate division KSB3 bacterium]